MLCYKGVMKIKVHMVAFEDPIRIRMVDVPKEHFLLCDTTSEVLELVFKFGQNDFQPQQCCSVSVGDVVELPHEEECEEDTFPADWEPGYWMVSGVGFTKITPEQFLQHKSLPQSKRSMNAYSLSGNL
jgi:hypothetical protein